MTRAGEWRGRATVALQLLRRPSRRAVEQTTLGRRLLARLTGMRAGDVLRVLDTLADAGIVVSVGGGWGLDALLGRQTRPHIDLDLVVPAGSSADDVTAAMTRCGFTFREHHRATGVALATRWVYGDRRGRRVDVLPVAEVAPFDRWVTGHVRGRPVRCLSVEAQQAAHRGYPWRREDLLAQTCLDEIAHRQ